MHTFVITNITNKCQKSLETDLLTPIFNKEMKQKLLFLLSFYLFATHAFAQDDDIYFVPKKKSNESEVKSVIRTSNYSVAHDAEEEDWSEGRVADRDVDEYNRRGGYSESSQANETVGYVDEETMATGTYTQRIVRFHSPMGTYVSSPYYSDYIDIWLDPWYDFHFTYGWGWYGWNNWYCWSPFHHSHWWNPWYDPFYPPYWHPNYHPGYHPGHHPGYHPGHQPNAFAGKVGPNGGYVSYGKSGNNKGKQSVTRYGNTTKRNNNSRPSRNFGNSSSSDRKSNNYNNSSNRRENSGSPSRNYGNSNSGSQRNYGNSGSSNSRSFSTPSSPSRNSGGARSGGGRSFGGRR